MNPEVYQRKVPRCSCCGRELPADGVLIDESTGDVIVGGKSVTLSLIEVRIVNVLYRVSPRFLDREQILIAGWGRNSVGLTDRAVDAQIKRIRPRIRALGLSIETGYSFGYRFVRNVKA